MTHLTIPVLMVNAILALMLAMTPSTTTAALVFPGQLVQRPQQQARAANNHHQVEKREKPALQFPLFEPLTPPGAKHSSNNKGKLLATLVDGSVTSCGKPEDIFQPQSIILSPDPPRRGQPLTVEIIGELTEDVVDGASADVQVKLGVIKLLDQSLDLCKEVGQIGRECPIEKGHQEIRHTVDIPREVPPFVGVTVLGVTYDPAIYEIVCSRLNVENWDDGSKSGNISKFVSILMPRFIEMDWDTMFAVRDISQSSLDLKLYASEIPNSVFSHLSSCLRKLHLTGSVDDYDGLNTLVHLNHLTVVRYHHFGNIVNHMISSRVDFARFKHLAAVQLLGTYPTIDDF
ncbi:Phosphatidylglycerol/phosphatidylinositol transfer protein [Blyttiomyces sp. JEL0837]|nr:Phosphatidylglycerol/phosphatidylinositol transfer protein [Blyttiomyces sp. JEL0837]